MMDAPTPVVLGDAFELERSVSERSEDGEAVLEVYPSSALAAAGLKDTYTLSFPAHNIYVTVQVPDGGGNAADMRVV